MYSLVNLLINLCLVNALVVHILVPYLSRVMLVSLFSYQCCLDQSTPVFDLQSLNLFKEIFILNISRNGTFLHSIVKAFIIFQSFRTILLLYASGISAFTNSVCVLQYQVLLSSIFQHRKSKKTFIINILLKCE